MCWFKNNGLFLWIILLTTVLSNTYIDFNHLRHGILPNNCDTVITGLIECGLRKECAHDLHIDMDSRAQQYLSKLINDIEFLNKKLLILGKSCYNQGTIDELRSTLFDLRINSYQFRYGILLV